MNVTVVNLGAVSWVLNAEYKTMSWLIQDAQLTTEQLQMAVCHSDT